MQLKFWGVRGSTPTPQPENLRYGGNTSCVEVRLNGHIYIFDCGTGFRIFGNSLLSEFADAPLYAHIFLSHFHWDHIQGIPFFSPLYENPDNYFFFHSSNRGGGSLRATIEHQMADPYFPVNMTEMAAHRNFYDISEGRISFDDCVIDSMWLNHPQGCLGFRITSGDSVAVYATDNEPGDPIFDRAVRTLADGADVLIYDAQYTPEEYEARRKGWGHSHWREGVKIARESRVRQLVLYHHDPDHSDERIDEIVKQAQEHFPRVVAASEGLVLQL